MRILVISHNAFGDVNNMGKTLKSYFCGSDPDEIAQIYVQSEEPDGSVCRNSYRITDVDMIRSILTRRSGKRFSADCRSEKKDDRAESGMLGALYKKGKERSPAVFAVRNLLWRVGKWKTAELLSFVDDFDPQVVFFASGDYSFTYRIAETLARYKDIPLCVSCVDDFYFYNRNEDRFLGKAAYRSFMKQVRATMNYASCILTICDKMTEDYSALFGKPCYTVHTPYTVGESRRRGEGDDISYLGNISGGRADSLIKIGRALMRVDPNRRLKVYSTEKREELISLMCEENGIDFRGGIPSAEILTVMDKSMAVIHTESFAARDRAIVRYSVSTKIADSMAYGCTIFAFGPEDVASMKYLSDMGSALCVSSEEELAGGLERLISDGEYRKGLADRAHACGRENHDPKKNQDIIMNALAKAVGRRDGENK